MQNKGSSTVEMSVIMVVVFVSLMLMIQCYFTILRDVRELSSEMKSHSEQACDIDDAVRRLRRWKWIDEKI